MPDDGTALVQTVGDTKLTVKEPGSKKKDKSITQIIDFQVE